MKYKAYAEKVIAAPEAVQDLKEALTAVFEELGI